MIEQEDKKRQAIAAKLAEHAMEREKQGRIRRANAASKGPNEANGNGNGNMTETEQKIDPLTQSYIFASKDPK